MQGCPQLTVHIALRRLSGRHDGLSFLEVIKEMFVDEVDKKSKVLAHSLLESDENKRWRRDASC